MNSRVKRVGSSQKHISCPSVDEAYYYEVDIIRKVRRQSIRGENVICIKQSTQTCVATDFKYYDYMLVYLRSIYKWRLSLDDGYILQSYLAI